MNNRSRFSIAFFSTARSDLGLLSSSINQACTYFDVTLFAFGSHTNDLKGTLDRRVKIEAFSNFNDANQPSQLPGYLFQLTRRLHSFLSENLIDCAVIMGDRWEMLTVGQSLLMRQIPIAHLSGGEVTYGVIDDNIRHALTKLCNLHFCSTEIYRSNVIAMGEEPWRVFNVGEPGLDDVHDILAAPWQQLSLKLDRDLNSREKLFLITIHPETRTSITCFQERLNNFFKALESFPDVNKIFTAPGQELGSSHIRASINDFLDIDDKAVFCESLGRKLYLQTMNISDLVLGNSSSGIIEAPSLRCTTVNIGARQSGRIRAESIHDCDWKTHSIESTIYKALEYDVPTDLKNPYDLSANGNNTSYFISKLRFILNTKSKKQILNKVLEV